MEYTYDKKKKRIIINKVKYDYLCYIDDNNLIDGGSTIVIFLRKRFLGYSREIYQFFPLSAKMQLDLMVHVMKKDPHDYLINDRNKLFLMYNKIEDKFYDTEC